jgi:hypothetical protein
MLMRLPEFFPLGLYPFHIARSRKLLNLTATKLSRRKGLWRFDSDAAAEVAGRIDVGLARFPFWRPS